MGVVLSKDNPELTFFRSIDMEIVNILNCCLRLSSHLDSKEVIMWSEYFNTLKQIRQKLDEKCSQHQRTSSHPACSGYQMTRTEYTPQKPYYSHVSTDTLEDGTDESPSRISEDAVFEANDLSLMTPLSTCYLHPVFWQHAYETIEKKDTSNVAETRAREERAIANAIDIWEKSIHVLETKAETQQNLREKKISQIQQSFESSIERRKEELVKNERELPAAVFRSYKVRISIRNRNHQY